MKLALVIGRCPRGVCGTGDYTALLSDALRARGVDAHLIESEDWRVRGAWKVRESLRTFDVVHIVYPTLGFGYKLGPQVLSLLQGCVISIQEASQRRILRKLSLLPFLVRPKHVIFNSEFEMQYVTRKAPWIAARSSLIPAPTNIRAFPGERPRVANEVVHFGLIAPHKGLEDVIELSRLIQSDGLAWKVRIIGGLAPERMEYFQKLKAETAALPVIWDVNRSEEEVAERLASSAVAYFPFPDGASERRSSFKAALANGVAVVTTSGAHTTEAMKTFQKFAETPREALGAIHSLLQNPPERARLARNAADFLLTWERSAELHEAIYRRLLCADHDTALDAKGCRT
ncbi:MAG: glycosyltransferase family 4 protein [Terracidiphilus sp.]